MIGVLTTDEIDQVLRRHRVGRIACSQHDRPYIVPITYAYDGAAVYSYSGLGRKIEVMREQPMVCFEVDEMDGPGAWRSVVAEGTYEELTGGTARRDALVLLGLKAMASASILQPNSRGVVFRILLTGRSGRFERWDD